MGTLLIVAGLLIAAAGLAIQLGLPLGRLPGDIVIRRGDSSIYIPIVTCVVISIVLSIVSLLVRSLCVRCRPSDLLPVYGHQS